jgi:hypothetical protein
LDGEIVAAESARRNVRASGQFRIQCPQLFARIKRLPKKARSTRRVPSAPDGLIQEFPSLMTYFRQGRLDKFYLANSSDHRLIGILTAISRSAAVVVVPQISSPTSFALSAIVFGNYDLRRIRRIEALEAKVIQQGGGYR